MTACLVDSVKEPVIICGCISANFGRETEVEGSQTLDIVRPRHTFTQRPVQSMDFCSEVCTLTSQEAPSVKRLLGLKG